MPFEDLRKDMVESQIKARGISDPLVISAMSKVERHLFVPNHLRSLAYDDSAMPIGEGQTISQPYMVAKMTELLGLKGGETVLEVGTGSGYQTAILAELAKKVVSVERIESLAEKTRSFLKTMGYANVEIVVGDGSCGYEKESPYDAIIVTAACPDAPQPLIDQLKDNGRIVIPIGERFHQTLIIIEKKNGKVTQTPSIGCVFVPLIGKCGFN